MDYKKRGDYKRLSSWDCKFCMDKMPILCISSAEYSEFSSFCSCTWASTIFVLQSEKKIELIEAEFNKSDWIARAGLKEGLSTQCLVQAELN